MTLLKTILIILLVYYGLKILARLLMPYLMRSLARKVNQKFQHSYQGRYSDHAANREGEVSIDHIPNQSAQSNSEVGEYVDFEEID